MPHCAVCFSTQELFQCACEKKIYCSTVCQKLDFDRHSITCSIDGKIALTYLNRFSENGALVVVELERLCDMYGPSLKFLFSMKEDKGVSVQHMQSTLKAWMQELVNFCNLPETIQTIESIPVSSNLHTLLVVPFLNRDNNFSNLASALLSVGFAPQFIALLKYPTTGRPLFDMTLYAKWYTNGNINYIDAPKKKWEIIKGAGNEMLPFLSWGYYNFKTHLAMPVSRYQYSEHQGLYYNQADKRYGGTFFYFEPDSPAYLEFSHDVFVAPNKINAFNQLGWNYEKLLETALDLQFDKYLEQEFEGSTRFEIVREELFNAFGYQITTFNELLRLFWDIPAITYPTDIFKRAWWSVEDYFDQLLWQECQRNLVSTLILTRMAGYSRMICEVLMMEDRKHLFKNLYIVR